VLDSSLEEIKRLQLINSLIKINKAKIIIIESTKRQVVVAHSQIGKVGCGEGISSSSRKRFGTKYQLQQRAKQ
jgi:hypothetical protein